jgi:hypothetical protein
MRYQFSTARNDANFLAICEAYVGKYEAAKFGIDPNTLGEKEEIAVALARRPLSYGQEFSEAMQVEMLAEVKDQIGEA